MPLTQRVKASDVFRPADAGLAVAVMHDDARQIRLLASAGVDIDAKGDRGISMLQWAILNNAPESLRALLLAGADVAASDDTGVTAIHEAARVQHNRYLQILLSHEVDPNATNPKNGTVPLDYAIVARRRPQFDALLLAGADPGRRDHRGRTPLIVAAEINAMDDIMALLDMGADPYATTKHGHSFINYLDITPSRVLLPELAAKRQLIDAWLRAYQVPKS
jgi:ankyrin repeat protein